MNTTLTGLGVALLLALVTALLGPLFIDWGDHRAAFEAQASRLLGVPVKVLGDVDARLLPSPRIRFGQVVAGDEWAASRLTANSFELDIALTPLLRGEYQVSRLRVDGADLKASLSADGEVSLPFAPGGMTRKDLDAIAITDLDVTNSRVTLADPAANRSTVVDRITLTGEASSLAGPLKIEATGEVDGRTYTARGAAGRFDEGGLGQVKLSVSSPESPSFSFDGTLQLASKPRFAGIAAIAQAPAGEGEAPRTPWKIQGVVSSDIRKLHAEKIDLEYGPPGRELRLSGGLDMVLGPKASVELKLAARQIDLDRLLGQAKDAPPRPPSEVLSALAARFGSGARPDVPVRVAASVESIALGGDLVQGFTASAVSTPDGWTVEDLGARLPGAAALEASGVLRTNKSRPSRFEGALKLDAPNAPVLAHWLEGLGGERPAIALKTFRLQADLVAENGTWSLDGMRANADGADIEGHLALTNPPDGRSKVEARLAAEHLDLDALDPARLFGFVNTSRGADIALTLRAKKLTYAKVPWSGVDVDLASAGSAIDIKRLSIADLGGAKISATGRLDAGAGERAGRLDARIDAANLNGLVAVLRTAGAPARLVDELGSRASVIAPAALTATLSSAGAAGGASVKVSGSLGGTAVMAEASGPRLALTGPLKGKITAKAGDGARLFAQLGLPVLSLDGFGEASLEASLDGDLAKGADLVTVLSAGPDSLTFRGKANEAAGMRGRLDLALEDAGRYAVLLGRAPPATLPVLPFTAGGDLSWSAKGVEFARLAGFLQGRSVKGDLLYGPKGLGGTLETPSLSMAEIAAFALGPIAISETDAAGWPSGAVAPGLFDGLEGRVAIRTDRLDIAPGYAGGRTAFTLILGRNEFAVQDGETAFAGGRLKANFALRRAEKELSLAGRLALENAQIDRLLWTEGGGPAATGTLDLTADMLGTGPDISAIVAALTGSGSFTLRDARLAGIDAGAFERTLIAVENGAEPPDAADIGKRFSGELAMSDLEVTEVSSAFTIASGVVRVSNAAIEAPLVTAAASGTVDLAHRTLTADLDLRPKVLADIAENAIPQADLALSGPWQAPQRTVDTTAFANVLAIRAVEREVKRIEQMEAERKERERKAAAEEALRKIEEERRAAEAAEAARLKAIRDATGDVPPGDLPPPVDIMPKKPEPPRPTLRSSTRDDQSAIDFFRRPVVPEAAR